MSCKLHQTMETIPECPSTSRHKMVGEGLNQQDPYFYNLLLYMSSVISLVVTAMAAVLGTLNGAGFGSRLCRNIKLWL